MSEASADTDRAGPRKPGLSAKLLWLTILFVMIAEVLIYVPSVATFRLGWLSDRIASAQTAALVLEAAPDAMIPAALEQRVLESVGAVTISLRQGGKRRLLAFADMPADVTATYDLRVDDFPRAVLDAFTTLASPGPSLVRVIGGAPGTPHDPDAFVEVVIDTEPLRAAMWLYSRNILLLSLFISAITAALVYVTLHLSIVRPMKRLSGNLRAFRREPENPSRVIAPSGRRDEIGEAERALAGMQRDLQGALVEKSHLAALGLAVAKINHDLRNILASAQLFSDRLASVRDPSVQRFAPKILDALDRAIALCQATLTYGRASEPAPVRRRVPLADLARDVGDLLGLGPDGPIAWQVAVEPGLMVDADPDQLFRVLMNLGRNARQALEARGVNPEDAIRVSARREGGVVVIEVADTGPGVPVAARGRLFEAFSSVGKSGGTGLGLAIAAELLRAHGGTIGLVDGTLGATFRLTIPDRPLDFEAARAERRRA